MPLLSRGPLRFSLQAKVMAAVLTLLIVLPAITLWVVDRNITQQTHEDAASALTTARAVFLQSLGNRAGGLVSRYRNLPGDVRFLKVVGLNDPSTMQAYLRDLLEEFADDTELLAFVTPDGKLLVSPDGKYVSGARRSASLSLADFAREAGGPIRMAAAGEIGSGSMVLGDQALNVVAVPVVHTEQGLVGVLVVGVRLGELELQQLQPPQTAIMIVNAGAVVASTLRGPTTKAAALGWATASGATASDAQVAVINGEHFLALTGDYGRTAWSPGFHFVLLSSYEARLDALDATRSKVLGLSLAGIAASALVVWFFIRRVTRPLRELQESAEAVGRGDFSRRVERFSNDEFGELAVTFNEMTTNLQNSRVELEHAMQTVKSTQEQLIQSEKLSAVGQFVAGVAHELNNPLTAVIGFSELLQSAQTDEKTKGHLDRIAKSAHRCHKIVHSLLSFARQEAPERKLVDLHTVLEEVLEIMAYDLRTSNVTVVKEFAPSLPKIMADPHQLQQVFVNILGNARQAIEPFQAEGRIVVRTQCVNDWVAVEFQDNGPGIKPQHLARIFDPFFTTKPAGKGTGLGLSLSYGLIQEHGGKISATSELGHGATFLIELPVATNAGPAPLRRSGTPFPFAGAGAPTGKTILVIDDEQWILDLAGELLRTEGHAVETAASGQQAIELMTRFKFDVLVSDWKMPGLNGIRLYEHLLATHPELARRTLFMTGDVVSDTFQAFLSEHHLTCLSKPFAISEFRAAVTRMVNAKR
jgi:signal transduction histidine kinase/CheY-like chemotaxis protein